MIDYKIDDLDEGCILSIGKESLQLIEPAGEQVTLINEVNDYSESETEIKIDTDANVYIEQRWLVKVLPKTKFDKEFITHRKICVYYCKYSELVKEQSKRYGLEEFSLKSRGSFELNDDYNGCF